MDSRTHCSQHGTAYCAVVVPTNVGCRLHTLACKQQRMFSKLVVCRCKLSLSEHGLCASSFTGNAVVQDVAVTQYGVATHLPTWAFKDIEQLKLAADAKMRTACRMVPAAVRQLHAWRLLTPAYNAVGALGRQVTLHSRSNALQICAGCAVAQWACMSCYQAG